MRELEREGGRRKGGKQREEEIEVEKLKIHMHNQFLSILGNCLHEGFQFYTDIIASFAS